MQLEDRRRIERYGSNSQSYLAEFRRLELSRLPLRESHPRAIEIAEALLPPEVFKEDEHGNAQ